MARLTTQADIDAYGAAIIADGQIPMQINDVIFFLTDRQATGTIYNKTAWTTARNGATVWIEGGSDSYAGIDIGSNTALTVPSNVTNKNHVQFFNGRGNVSRTNLDLAGRTIQFVNFNYLVVDFETNTNPGLRDGWASGGGGTFGVRESNTLQFNNTMGLNINNNLGTMKWLEIRGCELTQGDFAKIRASAQHNQVDKFVVERNLISRSTGGEGLYLGATSAIGGFPNHENFIVRDNIIICTATEAIQLQQLGNGSRVHNNVVFIADHDYRTAFQPFQDTGIQLDLSQGDVQFYNNVILGYGSIGMQLFARDLSGQTPSIPFGSGVPKFYNNVFSRGKAGVSIRMHNSFIHAVKCVFRDNDVVSVSGGYDDVGLLRNYINDVDQTAVPTQFIGGRLPVGSIVLNPGESNTNVKYFNITFTAQDEPEFVNSGFDNIEPSKVTKWGVGYKLGKYHGTSATSINPSTLGATVSMAIESGKSFASGQHVRVISRGDATKFFYADVNTYSGTTLSLNNISNRNGSTSSADWDIDRRIPYTTGEFVWLAENQTTLPYNLYRCMSNHDSHPDTRPNIDTTNWLIVQWDANGKNQWDPAYSGVPVTTDFTDVAGDFRLVKGSTHHLLGRGLSCNEQRDDQTKYGWQWKETSGGTIRDIPGAYDIKLKLSDYYYLRTGRYYRFWVEKMNSAGGFEAREFSAWQQI